MKRNAEGIYFVEVTMRTVRQYPTWQDDLDIPDDREVLVHEDGSVNDAETGDRICEGEILRNEFEAEWLEHWGFQDSDELNGRR